MQLLPCFLLASPGIAEGRNGHIHRRAELKLFPTCVTPLLCHPDPLGNAAVAAVSLSRFSDLA